MHQLILLFLGILVTIIGALPFGIVNPSVVDVSIQHGRRLAMQIAYGAALVEVLFGVGAMFAGGVLHDYIQGNLIVNYSIIGVLVIGSFVFLFRQKKKKATRFSTYSGFVKGVFLNLISFQVFLFWLIAIAFLHARNLLDTRFVSILIFAMGIWLGKFFVLWIYAYLSTRIISKSGLLSHHINQIIGGVLFLIAVFQVFTL